MIASGTQRFCRQRSEQYFTSSQTRSHFLRQENGRPHAAQVFDGRSAFRTALPVAPLRGMGAGPRMHAAEIKAELGGFGNAARFGLAG